MITHYPSDTPISFSQFDNRCYSNRNDVLRSDEESAGWIDTDARIDASENRKKKRFFWKRPRSTSSNRRFDIISLIKRPFRKKRNDTKKNENMFFASKADDNERKLFFLTLSSSVSPTKCTHNLPTEQEKINEVINSLKRNMASVDLDAITRSNSIDAPYDELSNDTLFTGHKIFTGDCQNIADSSTKASNSRLISFEAVNRINSQIFPEVHASINTEVADNSLEFRNNQGHLSGILDVKIKSFENVPETSDQSCSNFNELRNLNPESSEIKELKRLLEQESMEESMKSETGSTYTSLRDEIGEKKKSYRDLRSMQRDISSINLDHAREKRQANKKILNFDKNNSDTDMRDESSSFDFFIMFCKDYLASHNVDIDFCEKEPFHRIYNEIVLGNIFYDPREIRTTPEIKVPL